MGARCPAPGGRPARGDLVERLPGRRCAEKLTVSPPTVNSAAYCQNALHGSAPGGRHQVTGVSGRPTGGRAGVDDGLRGVVVADVGGELGARRLERAVALDHVDLARIDAVGVLHPEGGVVAAGVGHQEARGDPDLGAGGECPAAGWCGSGTGDRRRAGPARSARRRWHSMLCHCSGHTPAGPSKSSWNTVSQPETGVGSGAGVGDGAGSGAAGAGSGGGSSEAMTAGPPPNPAGASATTSRRNATATVPRARASRDITLLDVCAGRTET